jgi:hypothetical protein
VTGRKRHVAAIVREMAPDWLNLGAEPDTEARLSGIRELNDPDRRAAMWKAVLDGLDRGTTKIATGIGTWSSTRFITTALAQADIDGVAIHLYPTGPRQIDALVEATRMARKAGKQVLLDEAWLYKVGPGEVEDIASNERIFKRDAWSFWTPLDIRFLRAVDAYARAEGVTYISPFWTHLYFASLPYDAALDSGSYASANAAFLGTVQAAVVAGRLSPLGEMIRTLVQGRQ